MVLGICLPITGERHASEINKRSAKSRQFGYGYDLRHFWSVKGGYIEIWAKTTGRAGSENKTELPPPIDSALYYGPVYVLMADKETKHLIDLDLSTWKRHYDKWFGGFEDLDIEETPSSDELEDVDPDHLTADGYLKDGFVVDSDDEEIEIEE